MQYGWFYEGYPDSTIEALPLKEDAVEYLNMEVIGNTGDYDEGAHDE